MRPLFLALALALFGCTASQCPGDPAALGRSEGREGLAPSLPSAVCRLSQEQLVVYQLAHRQGLSGYCTGARGWVEGQRGRQDPRPCQEQEHPDFVQALRLGAEYASFATEVERLRREIERLEGEEQNHAIRSMQRALAEMEAIRAVATVRGWRLTPPVAEER